MKKIRRNTTKTLSVLLAVIMALTMMQMSAFATDETVQIEPEEPVEDAVEEMDTAEEETTEPAMEGPQSVVVPEITVSRKGPALLVSWEPVEDADYCEVYRSYTAGSTGNLLKTVSGVSSYTDSEVASGKVAYYRVRAHIENDGFTDFSESVSNVIYRVYIETGHGIDRNGRWDPGCKWGKYQEAKLMLPICKSMAKYLRARGVYVYTDADKGNNRNLYWLLKHLKGYNVSLLVNVHCDYKKAPRGTLPLYKYSEQKKLAYCLNKAVHKNVKIRNRGLKKRKNLSTLNKTKDYCVACLFETGNIKKDNKILRKKYNAYGKGLAMGVCDYLGVEW